MNNEYVKKNNNNFRLFRKKYFNPYVYAIYKYEDNCFLYVKIYMFLSLGNLGELLQQFDSPAYRAKAEACEIRGIVERRRTVGATEAGETVATCPERN